MPLTIFNNASSFDRNRAHPELGHLGTRDRFNPAHRFDFPGKASALVDAASELQAYVGSPTRAKDFDTQALKPIHIQGSSRLAEEQALLKVHSADYLASLKGASEESRRRIAAGEDPFVNFGLEADVTAGTYEAALHSVGAGFDAIDVALQATDTTAFALVWPPGHHAEPDRAMGFCYLANAALAAHYARDHAIQVRPGEQNRVVVIDIDHHRGNGTAACLADKEGFLFVDLLYRSPYDEQRQRYLDDAREYPYSHDDSVLGVSRHPICTATNVHPIEFEGFQNHTTIIETFIGRSLPVIRSFKPDLVLWSLGLDSAKGDPLGGLGLKPSSFYTLIKGMRIAFPEARHCGVLEGGYEQRLSGRCLKPSLMALHDEPTDIRSRTFKRYREMFTNGSTR